MAYKTKYTVRTKSGKVFNTNKKNYTPKGETVVSRGSYNSKARNRSKSSKSSKSSKDYDLINGVKVYVGSDAAADQGKKFGGTNILNSSKGSGSSSSSSRLSNVMKSNRTSKAPTGVIGQKTDGSYIYAKGQEPVSKVSPIREAVETKNNFLTQTINNGRLSRSRGNDIKPIPVYIDYVALGLASPGQFKKTTGVPAPKEISAVLKNIEKGFSTAEAKLIDKFNSGQTLTREEQKEIKQITSKSNGIDKIIMELVPFVNQDSSKTWKKLFTKGEKLNSTDAANIAFDLISLIPGAGILGKGLVSGAKLLKIGTHTAKINRKAQNVNKYTKGKKYSVYSLKFTGSIVKDTGFAKRTFEASKEYYGVDEKYLNNIAAKLGVKNQKELYQIYISMIGKNTSDGKFKTDDVTNFIGIDYYKQGTVKKGQLEFLEVLQSNGFDKKEGLKILGNLEGTRSARMVGQVLGLVRAEVSSEKLARSFINSGMKKNAAVGIAGAREGLSGLSQEWYNQGQQINAGDIALAILTGASGSIYFSKGGLKKLKGKEIEKAKNNLAKDLLKTTSETKKVRYLNQVIDKSLKKNGRTDLSVKQIRDTLSKSEKDKIILKYNKEAILKKSKQKIPQTKAKLLLRDPVANILDPFEIVGDKITDIGEILSKKFKIKKNKLGSARRTKIRSKAFASTAATVKSFSKVAAASKNSAKAKAKATTKATSKATSKSTAKATTKATSKATSKSKAKATTKATSKATSKSKAKATTKSKVVTVPWLKIDLSKVGAAKGIKFDIVKKIKGKGIKQKLGLPINKALSHLAKTMPKASTYSLVSLVPVGTTTVKDISKPVMSGFMIKKLQSHVKVNYTKKKIVKAPVKKKVVKKSAPKKKKVSKTRPKRKKNVKKVVKKKKVTRKKK